MIKVLEDNFPELREEHLTALIEEGVEEGYAIEYKREFIPDIGKSVSSFANSKGGWVIVGVKTENNKPTGLTPVEFGANARDTLEGRCSPPNIDPALPYKHQFIGSKLESGKGYIAIKIMESFDAPHFYKGRIYVREGARSEPVPLQNYDSIERMFRTKNQRREEAKALIIETLNNPMDKIREFNHGIANEEDKKTYLACGVFAYPLVEGLFNFIYDEAKSSYITPSYLSAANKTFRGEKLVILSRNFISYDIPEYEYGILPDGGIYSYRELENWKPRSDGLSFLYKQNNIIRVLYDVNIRANLTQSLDFAANRFSETEYEGNLAIILRMEGVLRRCLVGGGSRKYENHYEDYQNVFCMEESFITPPAKNPLVINMAGFNGEGQERVLNILMNKIYRWFNLPAFDS